MQIVAKRGEAVFLLAVSNKVGRVLDMESSILYPENDLESIVARGYWENYTGKQNAEELIKQVKTVYNAKEDMENVDAGGIT